MRPENRTGTGCARDRNRHRVDITAARADRLPLGPDADAAAAAPAVVEQKAVVEPTELPKAVGRDRRSLPGGLPQPGKKPKEEIPKEATVQAAPSDPSVGGRSDRHADWRNRHGVAALGSAGPGNRRERSAGACHLAKGMAAHFDKYKRYPTERTMKVPRSLSASSSTGSATCFGRECAKAPATHPLSRPPLP